ncbi:MAG TPA: hydroxyacid dehydrogenase [Acidimicrobiia bacterium]|nr:hydroxyacid dehydrogenase [Acidimicrobiia bacterium]
MSPRPRVVIPEYLPEEQLDRLREVTDVVYDPDLYADRDRLIEELTDAEAIVVRNRTIVDADLLEASPRLMAVGRLGVGLDNIDMDAASSSGVEVFPAYGGNAVSVAEYVLGAMLHLSRGIFGMTESMRSGHWPRQGHAFGRELSGKTLGLVGFGSIARHVGRRAAAFDMTIVASDPFIAEDDPAWAEATRADLDELLTISDFVSVHVPLGPDTRHLIDDRGLALMKDDAILINTSRGGVVEETALAAALRAGRLGGAALDVFDPEPLDPASAAKFEGLDNLVLTPHLAGNSREAVERIASMTIDSVLSALGLGQ